MVLLARNWWAFVLRGVLAVLFGIFTFLRPGMALMTLILVFGFYALFEGVLNVIAAFRRNGDPDQQPWWALLIEGLLSIGAGLFALFVPGLTAFVLLYIIAGWAIATGIMEIIAAVRLRRQIRGEWMLVVLGVLSIATGVLLALFPGPGALAVVLWIGAYAVVFGGLLIGLGFRLRRLARPEEPHMPQSPRIAPGH
ncbi:MAG: hypothetical protein JWN24_4708 [Phycisphaerales bacterium]|nr:hypothetical protein [Phycisphaerales bacterium]